MEKENVFIYMQECIEKKRKTGKDSTADLYRATCNHLMEFWEDLQMQWKEVTEDCVDRFHAHLKNLGLKPNSINSYLSNFRAMYNDAVKNGLTSPSPNPFTHLKLKREETEKRALPKSIIQKIAQTDTDSSALQRLAVDCFIFSYLACGMPFVDLANLTNENIHGDRIVYRRIKTGTKVSIGITPGMRLLLKRYRRKGALRLFPLLPDVKVVSHETYKRCLRKINECLKELGEKLDLPEKLTFYVARHSWASNAQEEDVPTAAISQSMGHASEKTTLLYLAGLSQKKLNRENRKVTKEVDSIVCRYNVYLIS